MATVAITINGVDRTNLIDFSTWQITTYITKDPDVLTFMIRNYPNKANGYPQLGDEVIVTYNGSRIYGGHVLSTDETIDGLLKYYTVTCKDYSEYLDQYVVAKVYTGQTAAYILNDLIINFCTGLTANSIQATLSAVNVPIFKANYITVRQAIKNLINIVGNYDYFVDYNADFHFFNVSASPSPLLMTDTSGNYVWNSLEVKSDLSQLCNVVLIRGATRTSTVLSDEYFSGDGVTTSFALAFVYGTGPSVKVGGVAQTVGNDGVDQDSAYQCMWNSSSQSLRFTAGNIPTSGTRNIHVQAYPVFPLLLEKTNEPSIETWGQYQTVIIDKNILDEDTASLKADAQLAYYSQPIYTLTFRTYVDGLVKGQLLTFQSTYRNIAATLNITQIVTTLFTPTNALVYDVTAMTAPPIGINEVLNKLLVADPASQITIDQTELIERYRAFTDENTGVDVLSNPTYTTGPYYVGTTEVVGFSTMG